MKKRLIAIWLCVVLLCGAGWVSATDEDTLYYDGMLLEDMGVLPLGFCDDPSAKLTRGELAELALGLIGYDDAYALNNSAIYYPDVPADHPQSAFIKTATELKFMQGDDTGLFYPDRDVTYTEFIKVMLCVVGYDKLLGADAQYPDDYIALASNYRLLRDITQPLNEAISHLDAAKIVSRLCELEIVELASVGEGQSEYVMRKDQTLLTQYHNVIEGTGQITANSYTGLYSVSDRVKEGYISVDNTLYVIDSTLQYMYDYLGYTVTFYYRELSNGEEQIVSFLHPEQDSITIDSKNIIEFSNNKLKYDRDGKTSTVSLTPGAAVIYNNAAVNSYTASMFMPSTGQVTFIDTGHGNGYDMAVIKSYENYVVQSYSSTDEQLFTKFAPTTTLDFSNNDWSYIVKNSAGVPVDISTVKEWDVISVAEGEQALEVIISTQTATGTVDGVEQGEAKKVTINSVTYTVSEDYENNKQTDLKAGSSGVFYFNVFGELVSANFEQGDSWQYAYLINASESFGSMSLKLLDLKGETKVYTVIDTLYVDGYRMETADVIPYLKEQSGTGTDGQEPIISQLVKIRLNAEGDLTGIDTANISEREDPYTSLRRDMYDQAKGWTIGIQRMVDWNDLSADPENIHITGNGVRFELSTPVIFAPYDTKKQLDETEYTIGNCSSFVESYDHVDVYDIDKEAGDLPGVVVIRQESAVENFENSPVCYVSRVTDVVNSDGETVKKVYAIDMTGTEIQLVGEDAQVFQETQKHDIIRYITNTAGQVAFVRQSFRPTADMTGGMIESTGTDMGNMRSANLLMSGILTDKFGDYIQFSTKIPDEGQEAEPGLLTYQVTSGTKVVLADIANDKTTLIGPSELEAYMHSNNPDARVFLYARYATLGMMVIYLF